MRSHIYHLFVETNYNGVENLSVLRFNPPRIRRGISFTSEPNGLEVEGVFDRVILGEKIFPEEIMEKELLVLVVDGELRVPLNPGFQDLGEDEGGRTVYLVDLPRLLEGTGKGIVSGRKVRINTSPGKLEVVLDEGDE